MALDPEAFADLAVKYLQEEFSNVTRVKSVSVNEVTAASGETRYELTEHTGPVEIDPIKARPEMLALGRAIVAFLQQQAEVSGGKIQ
jgi:hypothetical protein